MKLKEIYNKIIIENTNNKTKLIAYHGLSKDKAAKLGYDFDIKKFDTKGSQYQRVAGAYFTPFLNEAKQYAKREGDKIYKVELKFDNLADEDILNKVAPLKPGNDGEKVREMLIENGYDGVYDKPMKEIIVFYPEQIKILEVIDI